MTLARSLILHLHAKARPFHEALLPINIFIEHYYLGKREKREREKEKSEMTSSANNMMMSHLFFAPLYIHIHTFNRLLHHSGLLMDRDLLSVRQAWSERVGERGKWDMEMIGERKNHCKLKNFCSPPCLLKNFLFSPVTLSIYKSSCDYPARTVMGKLPVIRHSSNRSKVMERLIEIASIWFACRRRNLINEGFFLKWSPYWDLICVNFHLMEFVTGRWFFIN